MPTSDLSPQPPPRHGEGERRIPPPPVGEVLRTAGAKGRGGPTAADSPDYPHDTLWDALREVDDPEMAISLVDMGMIVDIQQTGETARVALTYTAMGCPATEMIEEDIRGRLLEVPGISRVLIDVVWEPVWTKARLTAEARDALLLLGVAI